jgi:two-component system LytT family response regulator
MINSFKPDLVFLDIRMPVYSGFDVLEKTNYKPLVIFTTAYDEFALKAFEANSVDYLLKPIDSGRLKNAINKLDKFSGGGKENYELQLKQLIDFLKQPKQDKLSVKIGSKIMLVDINDILYFKASEKYVEAYTKERKYLVSKSLMEIEEEFNNSNIVKIHRSYIVNFNNIESFEKTDTGEYMVKLKDLPGVKLPVSRNLKHKLGL